MEKYTLPENPKAAELKNIMTETLDAEEVVMSGSGPTIVAYYTDENKAASDMEVLRSENGGASGVRMWLTDTGIQLRGKEK
jgi:4-diphosphocytidyl-2-C-methyl-D-erythritol kinase